MAANREGASADCWPDLPPSTVSARRPSGEKLSATKQLSSAQIAAEEAADLILVEHVPAVG